MRPALLLSILLTLLSGGWGWGAASQPAHNLVWNTAQNRVSAEITSGNVLGVLQQIASATSWQIFVEPNTQYTVSTKFKDRTPGEALKLLLGDLNFALLPQTNGPSRLYVFRTTLQEATQLVRAVPRKVDKTAIPIPNELVITLKPGARIDELARKVGAKVLGKIDGMNAYRLSFDSADAADAARSLLKSDPMVESVSSNFWTSHPDNPEGLALSSGLPFDLKPRSSGDCSTPVVGLVDTVVQPSGGPLDSFLLPAVNVTDTQAQVAAGQPSHGTAMFETILRALSLKGKETSVKILPVDVYGNSPTSTTFDVAHGIVEAANRGANVINLSLGSSGDSDLLKTVIQKVSDQGVMLFAAAGNEPGTAPTYPAAYPQVVAVTAGTRDGSIASYANSGSFVDLVAPGNSIVPFDGATWLVTGTSASTAYASGLAASFADCTKVSNAQVLDSLRKLLPVKK